MDAVARAKKRRSVASEWRQKSGPRQARCAEAWKQVMAGRRTHGRTTSQMEVIGRRSFSGSSFRRNNVNTCELADGAVAAAMMYAPLLSNSPYMDACAARLGVCVASFANAHGSSDRQRSARGSQSLTREKTVRPLC